MTLAQRQTAVSIASVAKDWTPAAGGLIAVIYFGLQCIAFLNGGVKSGNQVDLAAIGSRVTVLESAQKAALETQVATVAEIRSTKDAILERLNNLPRPTDYSAQDSHLSRLDDRVNRAEIALGSLDARVGNLEPRGGTFRNPPPQGRQ